MQVSHQNDHITHAVIGGKQSIEFGISNSAEFFNILSSTLYKDQILAVVREVLCNAWDAHIEAGCTDRPVLITLTEDKFTVQDFGKGIHQDDIGPIYGVYGNSTKKNDGKQTGGFGLGCKAPFAYTDHFEVTSCHAGIKTIYNMSKSSSQVLGKPGITPIASFPTTDSGLTVSIRIKPTDFIRFRDLICRIAHNGDMNMQLNGKQIQTLDFDTSKGNFLVTRSQVLGIPSQIMVRYGNVIYPVDRVNPDLYDRICSHLESLRGMHAHFSIIFQAPPHSIAVTPSRESLSMQEHTVATLKKLFDEFVDSLDSVFQEKCTKYAQEVTKQAVSSQRVDELLKRETGLPVSDTPSPVNRIDDFEVMAKLYLQLNYPRGIEYRKKDITYRLQTMAQAGLLDKGQVSTFLRELQGVKKNPKGPRHWDRVFERTSWLQRRVLAPLLTKLAHAGIPTEGLYSCSREDHNWAGAEREGVPPLVSAVRACPHHLLTVLPYLRNIVVITTRRQDLVSRAFAHDTFKKLGKYHGFLVYVAGRKKGELEEARQFFAKQKMQVVDLTIQEAAEAAVRTANTSTRKPAKKGVTSLSAVEYSTTRVDLSRITREDTERIENPEFILQVNLRGYGTRSIDRFNSTDSARIVRMFGKRGGVTNNTATYTKWRNKEVMPFNLFLTTEVCKYLLNNPRIEEYWANHGAQLGGLSDAQIQLMLFVKANPAMSKEFGFKDPLNDTDKDYLALWLVMAGLYEFKQQASVIQLKDWISKIAPSPVVMDFIKKTKTPFLSFLNFIEFRQAVTDAKPTEIPKLIGFLKTVLNA